VKQKKCQTKWKLEEEEVEKEEKFRLHKSLQYLEFSGSASHLFHIEQNRSGEFSNDL
jgi:hypothetical protein